MQAPTEKKSQPTAEKPGGPEDREGAEQATQDNDLTTGHSQPGDGGDDNAKP